MSEKTGEFRLLVDGAQAFPEILRCIDEATSSIVINMFIWRDDEIGNRIAQALLCAADRGVRVEITKDRYGCVCEYSEEGQRSFFHGALTWTEWIKIRALILLYNRDLWKNRIDVRSSELAQRMKAHPNIRISCDENRFDHSKFYIFDDSTLILGGVNIEDKENGRDRQGRAYQDYMIRIESTELVAAFLEKRNSPEKHSGGLFGMNIKERERFFEMKARYLALIREAQARLTIVMAYFSPDADILAAIEAAANRGVDVRIMMPRLANFTDASNKRTIRMLMKRTGARVRFFLSDKMLHTKLLMSEKTISMGSTNIGKKAFGQLDELNLFLPNDGGAFAQAVCASVETNIAEATLVENTDGIGENRLMAFLEGLLM